MQRLEVSGAVRPIYGSLGVKRLKLGCQFGRSTQLRDAMRNMLASPILNPLNTELNPICQ